MQIGTEEETIIIVPAEQPVTIPAEPVKVPASVPA